MLGIFFLPVFCGALSTRNPLEIALSQGQQKKPGRPSRSSEVADSTRKPVLDTKKPSVLERSMNLPCSTFQQIIFWPIPSV